MEKKETWYRRWGDENGELVAVIRFGNQYKIRRTTPAWEFEAGRYQYRTISLAEARNFDAEVEDGATYSSYEENSAARQAGDKFFFVNKLPQQREERESD